MATMIPEQLPDDAPGSEKRVHEALKHLGAEWVVLWSVSWQAERRNREGDGEADFVLVNRRHGVIVLEVKGGGIHIRNGQWMSTDRFGHVHEIKNPYEQAVASKHALRRFISKTVPNGDRILLGHAVSFPDISIDTLVAPYANPVITFDANKLASPERFVGGLTRHWSLNHPFSGSTANRLVGYLRPTLKIVVTLKTTLNRVEKRLIDLTAEQVHILASMRANRRLLINGVAGSGKTVLAAEKAREFATDGLRTLVVCYNNPLAEWLSSVLADHRNVTVSTFHSLCITEARKAGLEMPDRLDEEWYDTYSADVLIEASQVNQTAFDALVIDEGQDFRDEWITALLLTLSDPDVAPAYVFMDSHQQLYRDRFSIWESWPKWSLYINCRNTRQIAVPVSRIFGDSPPLKSADGPDPRIYRISGMAAAIEKVQDELFRLTELEQVKPEQIAVLCNTSSALQSLTELTVGDLSLHSGPGAGVFCSTIHRFKGLEADVVVVLLADPPNLQSDTIRELLYVSLSRPRMYLSLVVTPAWHAVVNDLFSSR